MKYRKLRIAWSVAWGILCLLLIGLWVRSYQWSEVLIIPVSDTLFIAFGSVQGEMTACKSRNVPGYFQHGWEIQSTPPMDRRIFDERPEAQPGYRGVFGFGFIDSPPTFSICAPYWFFVVLLGISSTIPWLPWRFSLRTLLIVMTLVAVGLGVVLFLVRN
jgi:hypothetical protein